MYKTITCGFKRRFLRKLASFYRDVFYPDALLKASIEDDLWIPFFKGDIVAEHVWIESNYENAERNVFAALSSSAKCIFDVGANWGLYSLVACRACPSECDVIAIEASPIEYGKLSLSKSWNHRFTQNHLNTLNVAASAEIGEVDIYECTDGLGALNRLDGPAKTNQSYNKTRVKSITLDALKKELQCPSIDLIKLDIEGHELPALTGCLEILQNDQPVFMIEMNDKRASDHSSPEKIWTFMEDLGYSWFRAPKEKLALEPFETPKRFGYLNLFAVHQSKIQTVSSKLENFKRNSHG